MARKRRALGQALKSVLRPAAWSAMVLFSMFAGATLALLSIDQELFFSGGRLPRQLYLDLLLPGVALLPVVIGFFWLSRRRILDEQQRRRTLSDQTLTPVQVTTQVIEDRISQLSRASFFIYWTMVSVLIGGLVLIIFSGYLSSFDSVSSNLLARLDSQQSEVNSRLSTLQFMTLENGAPSPDAQRIAAGAPQEYARIAAQRELVLKAMLDTMKARDEGGSGINLSGTVLRVCIIGLLIFLVQILIQLYRYNSRLIAFYSSRRDALLMSDGEADKLEMLTRLFAPTDLDFGRSPKHPLQEMSSLLSRTAGGQGRTSEIAGTAAPSSPAA